MTYTTYANKEDLKGIFDVDKLSETEFKITITPISDDEKEDLEFKSLKGICREELSLDNIRKERLGLEGF